jgi:hypothetical protein
MPNDQQAGSYKLSDNLTFTGLTGTCLSITTSFVTIDLAGFSIIGPARGEGAGISADQGTGGITVRNGSVGGFFRAVDLGASSDDSIVEYVRVNPGAPRFGPVTINASGIIIDNIVTGGLNGIFAVARQSR